MQEKWEIIFLIYADFREGEGVFLDRKLVRELSSLFKDIAQARLKDQQVFIVMNAIRYKVSGARGLTNDKLLIYEVEKREGQLNKLRHFPSNETLNTARTVQDELPLGMIFEAIHQYSGADKTLLITWDHGSAFGVFNDESNPEEISLDQFSPLDAFESQFATLDDFAALFMEDNKKIKNTGKKAFYQQELLNKPIYRYKNASFFFPDIPSSDKAFQATLKQLLDGKNSADGAAYGTRVKLNCQGKHPTLELTGNALTSNGGVFNKYLKQAPPANEADNTQAESAATASINIQPTNTLYEMLTNEELADAIERGVGSVDVLVMMNCYMMNLHSCYALKEKVHYFIAPQSGIDEPGYDYKTILESLSQSDTPSPESLARQCLLSTFHASRTAAFPGIHKWAVFCVNLEKNHITELAQKIDDLAGYLIQHIDELEERVNDARLFCFRFDDSGNRDYNMIDITHFLQLLDEDMLQFEGLAPHNTEIRKYLSDMLSIREAIKLEEKEILGTIYEVEWVQSTRTEFAATGLSIYYPEVIDTESVLFKYFMAPDASNPSNLLREKGNWLKLLERIS